MKHTNILRCCTLGVFFMVHMCGAVLWGSFTCAQCTPACTPGVDGPQRMSSYSCVQRSLCKQGGWRHWRLQAWRAWMTSPENYLQGVGVFFCFCGCGCGVWCVWCMVQGMWHVALCSHKTNPHKTNPHKTNPHKTNPQVVEPVVHYLRPARCASPRGGVL